MRDVENFQEFVIEILKEYAKEQGVTVRSTSDLSPFEEWLLMRLYVEEQNKRG